MRLDIEPKIEPKKEEESMASAQINQEEVSLSIPWDLNSNLDDEFDLSSLACDAAIEIDNLVLGRSFQIASLQRISKGVLHPLITKPVEPLQASLVDPTTISIMHKAISDTFKLEVPVNTLDRLSEETIKIRQQVEALESDPKHYREQNLQGLKEMRSFFLALSRRAAAYERPLDEWEPSTLPGQ